MTVGDDEKWFQRRMFETSNRIRFPATLSDVDRDWWIDDVYRVHNLTPENVGDRLSASWAGDRRMEVVELDGVERRLTLNVIGTLGDGTFWILDRTIEFAGRFLNAERMFVDEASRGRGVGRRFMADAVALAGELGLERIVVEADDIGRYAWLRCGFVPDRGAWKDMQSAIVRKLVQVKDHLSAERLIELVEMASSSRPEVAREFAALTDLVPSGVLFGPDARPLIVPLGKAIFLEAVSRWAGSLRLGDKATAAILAGYLEGRS